MEKMNARTFKILLMTLGLSSLTFSQDFWRKLPAPATDYTYSSTNRILITSNDDIFIAAQDGVYRSTDGGDTWGFLIAAGEPLYVSEGGDIYAGTGRTLFKSGDGGRTWDSLTVPHRLGFHSLVEGDDGSILIGLRNADAILKSNDGGLSFSLSFGNMDYSFGILNSLLKDSAGKIFAMQDYRTEIYASADNGDIWDTLPAPAGGGRLKGYHLSKNGTPFYSTESGFVLTVDRTGTSLVEHSRMDSALSIYGNVVCARDDGVLFVSNSAIIGASYDNGAGWSVMDMSGMDTVPVFANIGIVDMEVDSRGYLYGYGPRGLYKTTNIIPTVNVKNRLMGNKPGGNARIHIPWRGLFSTQRGYFRIDGKRLFVER